jgi:hypothetical protein
LRKYGFTFITSLITAESFLLPYIQSLTTPAASNSQPAASTTFTPEIKLAIVAATLVLIIALQIMDRNYQVLAEAAAKRALVIENTLNIELTGVISSRFNQTKVKIFYFIIYLLFISGVVGLGWVALSSSPDVFKIALLVFSGLSVAAIVIVHLFKLELPRGPGDWTINGLNFSPGNQIGITLFSLCPSLVGKRGGERRKSTIFFPPNEIMWEIRNEENGKTFHYKKAGHNGFELPDGDSHLWLYTFPQYTPEGVYEIWRNVPEPITTEEALKQLLLQLFFGNPITLRGYFKPITLKECSLEKNQNSSKSANWTEELSFCDLLAVVFTGKKIWKRFRLEPLPQNIVFKKKQR